MLKQSEIALVQDSFFWAFKDKDTLAQQFYDRLFAVAPATKILFSGDRQKQRSMFIAVFGMIMQGLNEPEKLRPFLTNLGESHAKMGVRVEYYQIFVEVFAEIVLQSCFQQDDKALEDAWRNTLEFITDVMKQATKATGLDTHALRVEQIKSRGLFQRTGAGTGKTEPNRFIN